MANDKTVHGRVTCPVCLTPDGVRITKDKNGQPFGFCDATCEVQIRIGGKTSRVNAFYKAYPKIAAAMQENAVTVTDEKPVTVTEEKQPQTPVKETGFQIGNL